MARIPTRKITVEDMMKGPEWVAELKRRMSDSSDSSEDIYDNERDADKADSGGESR